MSFFSVLTPLGQRKRKSSGSDIQTGDTGRFRASGTWAEHDRTGHATVRETHGLEAARKFGIPR